MSDLLHALTGLPTAPFKETAVLDYIRKWSKQRRFRVTEDRSGNLLIEKPTRSTTPRLVLVAHSDHPGFIADDMPDAKTLRARFHGYIQPSFFVGNRIRFFTPTGETTGKIVEMDGDTTRPAVLTIRVAARVPAGSLGMWDVGGPRVKGQTFYSRACDDLAGLAAGLEALDLSSAERGVAPVAVLVTRAEEEGFVGAIAAAKERKLLRKTDRIISIETSAEQPYAKQGDGMVLRIGDRTSVFHSAFSRFMGTRAEVLAKEDVAFKFQRALMPGGTCEATVFDAFGYICGAVCVPLGNYHNMNPASGKPMAEYIDLRDWRSLVRFLTDICLRHGDFKGGHDELQGKLGDIYAKWKSYL